MARSRPPADDLRNSGTVAWDADGRLIVSLRVTPRAKHDALSLEDGALRVWVHAAPVDGGANEAVIALLANRLNVPRRAFTLLSGASSRQKRIAIAGVTAAELLRKLQPSSS